MIKVRRIARGLLLLPAAALALAVLGSYGGAVHPVGDSLAVFRAILALALGAVALLLIGIRAFGWGLSFAALAGVAGLPILVMSYASQPDPSADALRVYSKNTLGRWGDPGAIASDITRTGADIILLQELTTSNTILLDRLRSSHPHQHICQFSGRSGIAVLARWPLSQSFCSPVRAFAGARVATPDGPVWAVSTHLTWPFPYDQAERLQTAMPQLSGISGPAVVGGDFNMTPWARSVRQVARATGTTRIGRLYITLRYRDIPFTIDHILTTGQGTTQLRPLLGADHHGILADITLDHP